MYYDTEKKKWVDKHRNLCRLSTRRVSPIESIPASPEENYRHTQANICEPSLKAGQGFKINSKWQDSLIPYLERSNKLSENWTIVIVKTFNQPEIAEMAVWSDSNF